MDSALTSISRRLPFDTDRISARARQLTGGSADGPRVLAVACGTTLLTAAVSWVIYNGPSQTAVAGLCLILLASLALTRPRAAVVATFVYLAILGDIRRYVVAQVGTTDADPLLLVGPFMAGLLLADAAIRRKLNVHGRLAKLVAVLAGIMVIEMFNPNQGGISVGIGGAIFYLTPLAWFWIGRVQGGSRMVEQLLTKVVVPIAVAAAILGLYQTLIAFLPYEQRWIDTAGTNPLYVGKSYRPFGFFVSQAEYAHYMGIGLIVLLAPLCVGKPAKAILFAPLLLLAIFLFGARGPISSALLTVSVIWAARGRTTVSCLARGAVALGVGIGSLLLTMSGLSNVDMPDTVAPYVARQTGGFLAPGSSSTAGLHGSMFLDGVTGGLSAPAGQGLGATTLAAQKFGIEPLSSEVDFSNLMISLGVGGLLYGVVIVALLTQALTYWRRTGDAAALLTLAILIYELGQWLTGGHYAVVSLIWFCAGSLNASAVALPSGPAWAQRSSGGFSDDLYARQWAASRGQIA